MQMSVKNGRTLVDLHRGEEAVIAGFTLPDDISRRLMELGFLPGHRVKAGASAPGGDPRVFEVDGSQVAVRGETAQFIQVER